MTLGADDFDHAYLDIDEKNTILTSYKKVMNKGADDDRKLCCEDHRTHVRGAYITTINLPEHLSIKFRERDQLMANS